MSRTKKLTLEQEIAEQQETNRIEIYAHNPRSFQAGFDFALKFLNLNKMEEDQLMAIRRFFAGEQPSISTFIDEDTIIMGYGGIPHYDFEEPLPPILVKRMKLGTNSHAEYHKRNIEYAKLLMGLYPEEFQSPIIITAPNENPEGTN